MNKLDRKEYSFEKIDRAELYPCCLWEFARESRTVLKLINTTEKHIRTVQKRGVDFDIARKAFAGVFISVSKVIWHAVEHNLLAFPSSTLPAWIDLPGSTRQRLASHWPIAPSRKAKGGPENDKRQFAPPDPSTSRAFDTATWNEYSRFVASHSGDLKRNRGSDIANFSEALEKVLPLVDVDSRFEIGAFVIDRGAKTDDIVAAFRHWLTANPREILQFDDRGHKLSDFTVALRRLGIMRRICADPELAEAEWNKEARRALRHFSEFVNVPKGEMPIHWPSILGSK